MRTTVELASFLDSDPNHRGGRPFIRGTRVSVARIGILHCEGLSPDEIARETNLALPQVYASLAYYLANKEAIDDDVREQDDQTLEAAEASSWGQLC